MECFIKKIFSNRTDEKVHEKFVRFGKGKYEKRAVLSLSRTNKIKLTGSFEYANDFVLLASEFPVKFSGIILSKKKLELEGEKKKSGLLSYEVFNLPSDKIKEIADKTYYMLLDCEGELNLKIKKKLPKPGKSGDAKVNDKFCVLESGLNLLSKIKDAFFWDVPEGKKIKVEHTYIITDLIIPKDEQDFEVIRIKTKRKGKLIRKIGVDGKLIEKEIDLEV